MSVEVKDIFAVGPEESFHDVLGGYPDFSSEQWVEDYFEALAPDNRELLHRCAAQSITPWTIEIYIRGLVEDYVCMDPDRKYKIAINAAIDELDRLNSYVTIFLNAESKFPLLALKSVPNFDDLDDETVWDMQEGWMDITEGVETSLSLEAHQEDAQEVLLPLLHEAKAFLLNPERKSEYFDQEDIIARAREQSP